MKAPEKLYVDTEDKLSDSILYGFTEKRKDDDIEYVRKDDFIKKATNYLNYMLYDRVEIKTPGTIIPSLLAKGEFIEDFKSYMKE